MSVEPRVSRCQSTDCLVKTPNGAVGLGKALQTDAHCAAVGLGTTFSELINGAKKQSHTILRKQNQVFGNL